MTAGSRGRGPDEGRLLPLWIVHFGGNEHDAEAMQMLDSIALTSGLWLVRSDLTQSQLYHHVKRETDPTTLFVGRLDRAPKFKGMTEGSLATLRDWTADDAI